MKDFKTLRQEIIRRDFGRMNDRQFEAVTTTMGPLLVLAGAGSGKTTVIVNRIANLIKYGDAYNSDMAWREVTDTDLANMEKYLAGDESAYGKIDSLLRWENTRPWNILAITFTNKAAGELKERLVGMLGEEDGNSVWAATFHSCCVRILRRYASQAGYSEHFVIYDTDDSKRIMKECQKQANIDEKVLPAKSILAEISKAKDSLITPEEYYAAAGADARKKHIAKCYVLYQQMLKKADAMDFDDIIVNTVRLLRDNPDICRYYNDKFTHVCVDEYQDTNHAQFVLTELLAGYRKNLCVVGDDDQSIYKFRGATIENILTFEHHYAGAKVIRLEENYRSTQNILSAANSVIKNNAKRKGKNLWTQKGDGEKIVLATVPDERAEAKYVVDIITESKRRFSDFAILYRKNALSNMFEQELQLNGIPYKLIGGHKFYERKEIRDAIAYLAVISNPNDEVRIRRIINEPKRGIGETSLSNVSVISTSTGDGFFDVLEHADAYPQLSRGAKGMLPFAAMIRKYNSAMGDMTTYDIFEGIMAESGYIDSLRADKEKGEERLENIEQLGNNLKRFDAENPGGSITDFLEEIALLSDIDSYNADEGDSVVLMTLHSSKGLEFPVCFIAGMEEGTFPGSQSVYYPEEIEEERRLAYVGITRAKEKLYLTFAKTRMSYGTTMRNMLSRFCDEIPKELIEEHTVSAFGFGGTSPYGYGYGNRNDGSGSPYQSGRPRQDPVRPPVIKKPAADSAVPAIKMGDRVKHKKFGEGIVISARPMGNDILLEVAFDITGTKKLMARAANLEKLTP